MLDVLSALPRTYVRSSDAKVVLLTEVLCGLFPVKFCTSSHRLLAGRLRHVAQMTLDEHLNLACSQIGHELGSTIAAGLLIEALILAASGQRTVRCRPLGFVADCCIICLPYSWH